MEYEAARALAGDWFTAKGKIVYDPIRGSMKSKTDWWVVVELDSSITDYYRWWANRHINPLRYNDLDRQHYTWAQLKDKREDLVLPAWGAHMSIVRGERPRPDRMHLWKKYDGQIVEFKYSNNLRYSGDTSDVGDKNGVFWFVDSICDTGKRIRDELGFPSNWAFHITVGRTNASRPPLIIPKVKR